MVVVLRLSSNVCTSTVNMVRIAHDRIDRGFGISLSTSDRVAILKLIRGIII